MKLSGTALAVHPLSQERTVGYQGQDAAPREIEPFGGFDVCSSAKEDVSLYVSPQGDGQASEFVGSVWEAGKHGESPSMHVRSRRLRFAERHPGAGPSAE